MRGARGIVAAALATALAAPPPARADDQDVITYKVKPGDTLDVVAAELYGDHAQVIVLVAANKLVKPRPLRPGEKLRVPRDRAYVTSPGDRWPALAKALLGDERRAWLLASANQLDEAAPLPAGRVLTIPPVLVHVPAGPELLTSVAQQYLGDPHQADALKRYNGLDHDTLEKGEALTIPLTSLHVRHPAPLEGDARQRRDKAEATGRAALIAVPQATRAWRGGEYALVRELLAPIDLDYLDAPTAIAIGVLLGEAELAFDDADAKQRADAAFRGAVGRGAPPLRAFDTSPKIRAAWTAAGGTIEER